MQKLECVLLVDDDEIANFVHESLIDSMGITKRILVAKNGQEALDLIKQKELQATDCPNLILLDINMPVMNGFEFLEAYQQLSEELRQSILIILLTTSQNPKDLEQVKTTKVTGFLNKPLIEDKLKAVLETYY